MISCILCEIWSFREFIKVSLLGSVSCSIYNYHRYAEIKKYDWKNPGYQRGVGHFTQMVWKSSTKLGVGIAFNERSKKTYIVARYSPAGNFLGRFSENVMRLRTGTGGTGTGGTGSGGTGNGGNGNGGNGNGGTGTNGNAFAS